MQNSPDSIKLPKKFDFILFISGMSVKSSHAVENLRKICDTYIPGEFNLQIIDISTDPNYAIEYQIIAIPTLIKITPIPPRIILGDLSDTEKVLKLLEINH